MLKKAAFLFVFPDADSKKHRATVETPTLSLKIVGAKDFDDAVNVAKSLVEEGIQLIELCGGFGPVGTAKVIEAVGDEIPVASVSYGLDIAAKAAELFKE